MRSRKTRILLSGAVVSLVGYFALAVLVAEQALIVWDEGTRAWVRLLRHEALTLPMQIITRVGDAYGLVPLILAAVVVLWRTHRRWAVALPVLMAGVGATERLAKWAADRPRPDDTPGGFPSGHVLSLVVLLGLIVYLILTASKPRRLWRIAASAACLSVIVAVAFTRLYLDRHWLTDVGAGLAIGLAYLLLAIWVVEVVATRAAAGRARRS